MVRALEAEDRTRNMKPFADGNNNITKVNADIEDLLAKGVDDLILNMGRIEALQRHGRDPEPADPGPHRQAQGRVTTPGSASTTEHAAAASATSSSSAVARATCDDARTESGTSNARGTAYCRK